MIANHKGEIPVVVLILPFLAGITVGINFLSIELWWLLPLISGLMATFIFLNFTYNPFKIYKARWIGGLLLSAILFLLGSMVTINQNELNKASHFSKKPAQYLVGVISREPKIKNELTRFTLSVEQSIQNGKAEKANGSILITIKDQLALNLFYGEELLIPAQYNIVDPPFNPGEFNYKQYLANHNIHYQTFLYPKQYTVIKAKQGNPVIAYALQLRQNLVRKLQSNMRDTNAVAVASTLILGYKADLSNDILQAYSKTGTIHILSVSGGHVAIIYLLLIWALGFLNRYKHGKLIRAVLIITFIWGYALLTGFSPAVCRAAVMLSLIVAGKTYSRYINSLNLLAVSAFALLLYDPFLIKDVGFQLSYLAVGGLIIFQPIVYKWLSFNNWLGDKIWMACSVSISAQVITFPLSAYYFHQFPVYFLLSNLLIIIPVSIILYTGILLLLLPQISVVSGALGYVLEKSILWMNKALAFMEHAPFASMGKIWLSSLEYLLLYGIIIFGFYFIYNKKVLLVKATLVCALLFSVSISYKKFRVDNTKSITFLNMRKHTGIVFKNGDQGIVLSDLPETDKNFQYAIQPGLDSCRITHFKVYAPNSEICSAYLLKQKGLLKFMDKYVLLLNPQGQIQSIPTTLKTDYLYVNENPYLDKQLLTRGTLIIDGTNTNKYLEDLQQKLTKLNANYKILKRNKSITILSNGYKN
jgi:competence protein ComEC